MVLQKLEQRSEKVYNMNKARRLRRYARDGVHAKVNTQTSTAVMTCLSTNKSEPINLTESVIDKSLIELCRRGPSFVPIKMNVDWNDLQQGWLDFKRKVRRRAFFFHNRNPNQREYWVIWTHHIRNRLRINGGSISQNSGY